MEAIYRLRKNSSFSYTYNKGRSISTHGLVLVYAETKSKHLKMGVSVSKKVGKSVVRNKVKRRVKEAFRLYIENLKQSYNYIFIARIPVVDMSFSEISGELTGLLRRAKLFKEM